MEVTQEYMDGALKYWIGGIAKENPYSYIPNTKQEWNDWDNGWHDACAIDNNDIDGENHPAACPKGVF